MLVDIELISSNIFLEDETHTLYLVHFFTGEWFSSTCKRSQVDLDFPKLSYKVCCPDRLSFPGKPRTLFKYFSLNFSDVFPSLCFFRIYSFFNQVFFEHFYSTCHDTIKSCLIAHPFSQLFREIKDHLITKSMSDN